MVDDNATDYLGKVSFLLARSVTVTTLESLSKFSVQHVSILLQ